MPKFSILLFSVVVLLLGIFSIRYLQFNFLPQTADPVIQIDYQYPYADPEQVEFVLIRAIEAGISQINGIKRFESSAQHQRGYTRVSLNKSTDLDQLRFDILTSLRQLYPTFPPEVPFPTIQLNNNKQEEINPLLMVYSINAPLDPSVLYQFAMDRVLPQLAGIRNLERIDLSGANEQEWTLYYNHNKLEALSISLEQLSSFITEQLNDKALSYLRHNDESLYVKIIGSEIPDLMKLFYHDEKGRSIAVSELLSLKRQESTPMSYYRINGANSIRLSFVPGANANHLQLAKAIKAEMEKLNAQLPQDYFSYLEYDTTEFIRDELNKIKQRTQWSAIVLFLFVLIAYRRWNDFAIIAYSLLVTLAASFLFYLLFEVQLNLYALAAITVSFGIVIDNVVVMSHHYQHHQNRGIIRALLTATLTSLAALVIVLFLPEQLKIELLEFAKVLAINLCVSLIVCYFLVPVLSKPRIQKNKLNSYGNQNQIPAKYFNTRNQVFSFLWISRWYQKSILALLKYRKTALLFVVLSFGLPVFLMPSKMENRDWYNKSLGSDYYIENVKPWVNKIFGGSLRLFALYVYEGSSFRSAEESKLYLNASMPMGATLDQMNEVILKIERFLSQYDNQIDHFVSSVGSGQSAFITISFSNVSDLSFPFILKNRLESFAADLGGIQWNIYGVGKAFSNASGLSPPRFRLDIIGYNRDQLNAYADQFAELLKRHPRVQEVNTNANINWWEKDRFQYKMRLDEEQIAAKDISLKSVIQNVQAMNVNGRNAGRDKNNTTIRLSPQEIKTLNLWSLSNRFSRQALGAKYQLLAAGQLGILEKEKVSNSIYKENQQYIQKIEFEYTGSGRFGAKYLDECLSTFRPGLPLGYGIEKADYQFWQQKEKTQYGLLGLVIAIIFILCAIHFESFRFAFVIVTLAPLSFIGIFLSFYCFDFPFDQGGYTSFLMVSGLAVNSLILIFTDYQILAKRFPAIRPIHIYFKSFRRKITPIVISNLSTVFGILPFTLHGAEEVFWFSLAIGTMSGLLFSLFVISFVTPLFIPASSKRTLTG